MRLELLQEFQTSVADSLEAEHGCLAWPGEAQLLKVHVADGIDTVYQPAGGAAQSEEDANLWLFSQGKIFSALLRIEATWKQEMRRMIFAIELAVSSLRKADGNRGSKAGKSVEL